LHEYTKYTERNETEAWPYTAHGNQMFRCKQRFLTNIFAVPLSKVKGNKNPDNMCNFGKPTNIV